MCHGNCCDLQSDPYNCNTCGNACASPKVCSKGACADTCAAGLSNCGRYCVDLSSTATHCGKCYNNCGAGKSCIAGQCV